MKNTNKILICAFALATTLPFSQSCNKTILEADAETPEADNASVTLVFQLYTPTTSRASSVADFKKIWILDKMNGKVQQLVEQDAEHCEHFGSPKIQLVKGKHQLQFFATDAPHAQMKGTVIHQLPLGDSFYKSVEIDTQKADSVQRVVLERQVGQIRNDGTTTVNIEGLLSDFQLLTGKALPPTSTAALPSGKTLLTYIPENGYLTTSEGKEISVQRNQITVLLSKDEGNGGDDNGEDNGGEPIPPSSDELMVLSTDTAAIYVAQKEIAVKSLSQYPQPEVSFATEMAPYRMPTRREALALNQTKLPAAYWSGIRCLCYDSPYDTGITSSGNNLGTGEYYTFKWGEKGVLSAGLATAYCIKPIRSVPIAPIMSSPSIDADFTWGTDTTFVK